MTKSISRDPDFEYHIRYSFVRQELINTLKGRSPKPVSVFREAFLQLLTE